jgi:hypothetical protein
MPVLAGGEIPAGVGAEELVVGVGVRVGGLQQSLPGRLRIAGVVAKREAELIVFAYAIAEIADRVRLGEGVDVLRAAVEKYEAGAGVVEAAEEAAQLRAAASGIEVAAFGKDGGFGNAGGAAMGEDLNDTGDGVGAIDGGFGAAYDFDLVDGCRG